MTKRSIASLDGIRAISILAVILSHINAGLPQLKHLSLARHALNFLSRGELGVNAFFVVSGFLITRLLCGEMDSSGSLNLKRFYLRRSLRIFPAYYVFLCAVLALEIAGYFHVPKSGLIGSFTYSSNYVPYRLTHPELSGWPVGHTWSLSVEEQFYLLWPAVIIFAQTRRRAASTGLVVIAAAPILRILTVVYAPRFNFDEQIYRMFQNTADVLMFGCLLGLLCAAPRFRVLSDWLARPVVLAPACLYLLGEPFIVRSLPWWYQPLVGVTLTAACLTVLCWYAVSHAGSLAGKVLNWRLIRHVGVVSYSLYLWQQLFLGPAGIFWFPFNVLLVGACAEASYWIVERPFLRLRDAIETRVFAQPLRSVIAPSSFSVPAEPDSPPST